MKFSSPDKVWSVVDIMRRADFTRSYNRSLVNDLFNGLPPFTDDEAKKNNVVTNVNFLEGTKLAMDARRQYMNGFMKPGNFFGVQVDYGPAHKKDEWGRKITHCLNRLMKKSLAYYEVQRSTFAQVVLHGIGPKLWQDNERWCPYSVGIEDVKVPSGTLLSLENLDYFAIFRKYSPGLLYKMTHGYRVDPGWNMPLVEDKLRWAQEEVTMHSGGQFSSAEYWTPEKISERFKQDLGFYAADSVPTIDCWDFYYFDDDPDSCGWKRKIVLHDSSEHANIMETSTSSYKQNFLYDGGNKIYAEKLSSLVHFQFGDCSAVAPFRYHSVRSLGFLLYAICHMSNRLRCKLNDHALSQLMEYFRVNTPEDAARLQKIDLINFGLIPQGLEWVKAQDRYQVNPQTVEMVMQLNRQSMGDNSASFTQDYDFSEGKTPETATATMAKVNSASALVGAMLNQAYTYAKFEYEEICRRFCEPNSKDKDIREFRLKVLKDGVPEEALDCSMWNIEVEKVLGAGNKQLEIAEAKELMGAYPLFDPDSQRQILHIFTEATTDDPNLAERLVPIKKQKVSDARHDAQLAAGSLMMGLNVDMKPGMNHIDYVDALMQQMVIITGRIEQSGGMATAQEIVGLENMANHIAQHVQIIAQNPDEKQRVRQYMDDLGNLMNLVKGYKQRLAEQQQQQQAQGDPAAAAKVQAMVMQAETKAAIAEKSHAQKTAQRQAQWEMEEKRKQQQHEFDMAKQSQQVQLDTAATDIKTAAEIRREGAKAAAEPTPTKKTE